MRTETDLRAALLTLAPDPGTDPAIIAAANRAIARRRSVRRVTVTGVVAAAAAAALVVTLLPQRQQRPAHDGGRPVAGAARELRALALVAAAQPAFRLPGPGQYYYTASKGLDQSCLRPVSKTEGYGYFQNCYIRVEYVQLSQQWIAADGSGRLLTTTSKTIFPSAADKAHWIAAGRPGLANAPQVLRYRPHTLAIGQPGLGKLPRNPGRLAAVIRQRKFEGGPPGPAEDFTQVGDLLRAVNAAPALRRAAYQVGAGIAGVKSFGTVKVHGVSGLGIGYLYQYPHLRKYRGERSLYQLVFDPATSVLRAEVHVDYKFGKVVNEEWLTYLAAGLVNSETAVPRS